MGLAEDLAELGGAPAAPSAEAGLHPSNPQASNLAADLESQGIPTGPTVRGAIEALGRGATLGLADQGQAAVAGLMSDDYTRGRAEALAEIQQRQAGMGGYGTALEIGGAVLPGLVSGGAGLAAGVARAAPAALAEQAGAAVAARLGARFGAGVMSRMATHIAGGAATAGMAAGVQAIADKTPELTTDPGEAAEYVLAEMGKGALFGGAAGATLGGVRELAAGALRLSTSATEQARALAAKHLPALAEQRAEASLARGVRLPAEKPSNLGRILLDERIPLTSPDEALPVLEQKALAASQAVLDLEQQVARGAVSPDVLAAAAQKERALVYARDAASEAAKAGADMGGAFQDIALGALGGLALGGGPGAVAGAAVGKAARAALGPRAPGFQAIALDQLAQLAENKTAVAALAARGQGAIDRIVSGAAGPIAQGTRVLEQRWTGPELDAEIDAARTLRDAGSPERLQLAAARDQLEMSVPGLGAALEGGALRRAQLMYEGVPERSAALYSGRPMLDRQTRTKLGGRLRALREPEMTFARVMGGESTPDEAHVLRTAYPRAWSRFTSQLAETMQAAGTPPYRAAVAIGLRTGIATTDSLTPERLAYGFAATKFREQAAAQQEADVKAPAKPQYETSSTGKKWGWGKLERYGDKADRTLDRRAARGST